MSFSLPSTLWWYDGKWRNLKTELSENGVFWKQVSKMELFEKALVWAAKTETSENDDVAHHLISFGSVHNF